MATTLNRNSLTPARCWLLGLLHGISAVTLTYAETAAPTKPKTVFAHYMGCNPVGTGSLYYERHHLEELRHGVKKMRTITDGNGNVSQFLNANYFGGHIRNYDLIDPDRQLTAEESADLEIRRALRIGIDGFAVDAWAGSGDAVRTLDVLFKVAEEKNYPFALTVCLDPMCGGDIVKTVKELLEKHGKSPKLARRDGKPLIFGYQSWCYGMGWVWSKVDPKLSKEEMKMQVDELRVTPPGWGIMGEAFPKAAADIGQPIFWHYCLTAFFYNTDGPVMQKTKPSLVDAAAVIAKHVGAVGGFTWLGQQQAEIARAVRAAGAEWSTPVGMYQKENIPWEMYGSKGTENMSGQWDAAQKEDATLLQLITWNDYGENSNIAPGYNTRYTLYDLTGYYIQTWKTGHPPAPDHDRVYLTYHKHPLNAPVFPFHSLKGEPNIYPQEALEVVTILPQPAKVRLPGRNIEYAAPAGFHREQFPLTVGPVVAELVRDDKIALRLESPEPVTDKPFRSDFGLVCFSSEDPRLWREDFGNTPPFWYSEYGDLDHDGLPNWFEMYWFTKARGFKPKVTDDELLVGQSAFRFTRWLDLSTASYADPKADLNGDGKTNLEKHQTQRDPTLPVTPKLP